MEAKPLAERRKDALRKTVESMGVSVHLNTYNGEVGQELHVIDGADRGRVEFDHHTDRGVIAFVKFFNPDDTVETTLTVDSSTAASLSDFFSDLSSELEKSE